MEVVYKKTIYDKIKEHLKKEYDAGTFDKIDHIKVTREEMVSLMEPSGYKLPSKCVYQEWKVGTFVKEAPQWVVVYCSVVYDESNKG